MDEKVKILLGSEKNINSVNVDNYKKIELKRKENNLTEFNVNDIVNVTEEFDNERENSPIYRIYGKIEYLSLLNGLKLTYGDLEDFFNPQNTGDIKDIFNSFDFYLVAPTSKVEYINIPNTNNYKRFFEVIADNNDIEIYNAGFNSNVYGEQTYIFNFKSDFDVSNLYDSFGIPITDLFIYIQYKKQTGKDERMSFIKWSTSTGNKTQNTLNTKNLNVGDIVVTEEGYKINDIISYDKNNFIEEQVENQKFYIRTPYVKNGTKWLEWSYNPLISLKLRYLDSVVSTAKLNNIVESGTSFNITDINNLNNNLKINKTLKQNLSETEKTIINWDSQTNSFFDFNSITGIIKILYSGTYKINFKSQIYLSEETDKYIAELYLDENTGSGWNKITGTTRRFNENNEIQGINIQKTFNVGDEIRIRVKLIPNPNERKLMIIPDYATIIEDSGKFVWRDILRQGYIDPISNNGVDYPFFNGKRYLFSPIVFSVVPNLSTEAFEKHQNTIDVFAEMSYTDNAIIIDKSPITELDNINKPCQ